MTLMVRVCMLVRVCILSNLINNLLNADRKQFFKFVAIY